MTKAQIEALVNAIYNLAETAVQENENRRSDYAGIDKHRVKEEVAAHLLEVFSH